MSPTPPFRVAVAPGIVVARWTKVWAERLPDVPLQVTPTEPTAAVRALHDGALEVAFVRLPVDRTGLSAIPLWSEISVVVVPKDHPVSLYEEVTVADLVEEDLIQDPDSVPAWRDAAARLRTAPPRLPPEARTTADAVALVAAGLGVLIVPMSLARLHHRRDLTYRPVADADQTPVALVWPTERTTPLVEEFVGIVRGRTARSSRGTTDGDASTGTRTDGTRDGSGGRSGGEPGVRGPRGPRRTAGGRGRPGPGQSRSRKRPR